MDLAFRKLANSEPATPVFGFRKMLQRRLPGAISSTQFLVAGLSAESLSTKAMTRYPSRHRVCFRLSVLGPIQLVLNLLLKGSETSQCPGGLDFIETTGEELVLSCFIYPSQAPLQPLPTPLPSRTSQQSLWVGVAK